LGKRRMGANTHPTKKGPQGIWGTNHLQRQKSKLPLLWKRPHRYQVEASNAQTWWRELDTLRTGVQRIAGELGSLTEHEKGDMPGRGWLRKSVGCVTRWGAGGNGATKKRSREKKAKRLRHGKGEETYLEIASKTSWGVSPHRPRGEIPGIGEKKVKPLHDFHPRRGFQCWFMPNFRRSGSEMQTEAALWPPKKHGEYPSCLKRAIVSQGNVFWPRQNSNSPNTKISIPPTTNTRSALKYRYPG